MIFLGEQVDPDNYNRLLHADGNGPLPAQLEIVGDEPAQGLVLEDVSDSSLAALAQLNESVLERIPAHHCFETRLVAEEMGGVRVLARWNHASSMPAAIEKRYGDGRVLMWTITADKAWGNWPIQPSYVLTVREAAKAIARVAGENHVVTAGQPIQHAVEREQSVGSPMVEPPGGDRPLPLTVVNLTEKLASQTAIGQSAATDDAAMDEAATDEAAMDEAMEQGRALAVSDTRQPGLYRLTWDAGRSGIQEDWYAANPDVRESELSRIDGDLLAGKWSPLEIEVIAATDDDNAIVETRGREIWRQVACGLMGLLVIESCFATWVGRSQ